MTAKRKQEKVHLEGQLTPALRIEILGNREGNIGTTRCNNVTLHTSASTLVTRGTMLYWRSKHIMCEAERLIYYLAQMLDLLAFLDGFVVIPFE